MHPAPSKKQRIRNGNPCYPTRAKITACTFPAFTPFRAKGYLAAFRRGRDGKWTLEEMRFTGEVSD